MHYASHATSEKLQSIGQRVGTHQQATGNQQEGFEARGKRQQGKRHKARGKRQKAQGTRQARFHNTNNTFLQKIDLNR